MNKLFVVAAIIFAFASPVRAWGVRGHQIVALIAERNLSPKAQHHVANLLAEEGKSTMMAVANWADGVRALRVPIQPSHSVRLKPGFEGYNAEEDCNRDYCILAAIDASIGALKSPKLRVEARVMALKYLIHFVGDIHMPLHATSAGRGLKVTYQRREVTLHKVWDTYIIPRKPRNIDSLSREVEYTDQGQFHQRTPVDWAIESRDIARDDILIGRLNTSSSSTVELPNNYATVNWPRASARLRLAGLRLAGQLNEIFDNYPD